MPGKKTTVDLSDDAADALERMFPGQDVTTHTITISLRIEGGSCKSRLETTIRTDPPLPNPCWAAAMKLTRQSAREIAELMASRVERLLKSQLEVVP